MTGSVLCRLAFMVMVTLWAIAPMAFAQNGGVVELTYMHAFNHVNPELQAQIVEEFNSLHPGIRVNIEPVEWNAPPQLLAVRTAAGVAPDIISMDPVGFLILGGQNGLLRDLSHLVWRDLEDPHDIPPAVYDSVSIDGRILALPQRISTYVLFYNQDHFDQVGLALPPYDWYDSSWNWDRYRDAARLLTRDTNGDGETNIFGLQSNFPTRFYPWVFMAGGNVFNEDYSDFVLDQPEGMEAVDFVRDLFERGYVGGNFFTGTASMVQTLPFDSTTATQAGIHWNVAPLPQGPGGPATRIGPIAVGIPTGSQHPEEAWEFLRFYMNKENSARQSQGGVMVQPRLSVTRDLINYSSDVRLEHVQVFSQALEVGQPYRENHRHSSEMTRIIHQALQEVWRGEKSTAVALAEIRPTILALLNE